jgi:hypothetical protein
MAEIDVDIVYLTDLDTAFMRAGISLTEIRGEVRAFLDNALMQARNKVDMLTADEISARHRYDVASSVYYACADRQRYDEETGTYVPSCRCEERDMRRAGEELSKATARREKGERFLASMMSERDRYLSSQSGDMLIGRITEIMIPDASRRLLSIRDKVENHETMLAELTSPSLSARHEPDYGTTAGKFCEARDRILDSKVVAFREGMRRIKEKQEEQQRLAILRHLAAGDPNEHTR